MASPEHGPTADRGEVPAGEEPGQAGETPTPTLILPEGVHPDDPEGYGVTESSLGVPGRPLDRRTPFFIGLTGGLGVATAYVVVRGVVDIAGVLLVVGLALFIAVGLNPIIEWLVRLRLSRAAAVVAVTLAFLLVVAGFVLAAVPPIAHEVHALLHDLPHYRHELAYGHGWASRLVADLHLKRYVEGKSTPRIPVTGGVLNAGRMIVSVGVGVVSVVALTIYFLVALPGVKRLWLGLVPRTRRDRVRLLTDEVFDRVGGFMLGNLLTSLVSGVGTYLWLLAFGAPYPLLLGVFVALLDLVPMVGSTVGGVVVSLVTLTRGLPIAIATAVFYTVYRFLEDYLLNPRVMKHTVRVTPGLTIIATLIGGTLLGIVGALVAIPVAATVHLLLEQVTFPRQNER